MAARAPISTTPRRERAPAFRALAGSRVAYRRILVPLVDSETSEEAMSIACQLAAERGASVVAVTAIEVPVQLPLAAHMFDEEEHAKRVLAEAAAIGDLYGIGVVKRIVRARAAGAAVVEEARRTSAEIVVLTARRRRGRRRMLGKTVDFVLKHAPCRVMVRAAAADA